MFDDDWGDEMEAIETERLDADILQAEWEAQGNAMAAARKRGVCQHSSVVGRSGTGEEFYPEQVGLVGAQLRCTEGTGGCTAVFADAHDWHDAVVEAAA